METVLVTGGVEFIGPRLCARLLALGRAIIGVDTFDDHYVSIDDIVDAIVAILNPQSAPGYEIVYLGRSTPIPVSELIRALEWTTGQVARIRREPERLGAIQNTSADTTKAHTLLNWQPDIIFGESMRRFVAWCEASRRCVHIRIVQAANGQM